MFLQNLVWNCVCRADFQDQDAGWYLIAKTTIGLFSQDFLTKEGLDCLGGG